MATFKEIETDDALTAEPPEDGVLPGGVFKIALAGLGMLVAVAVPYALRADICVDLPKGHHNTDELAGDEDGAGGKNELCIADIRPWTPGDEAPFATLFKTEQDKELTKSEETMLAETAALADDAAAPVQAPAIVIKKQPEPVAVAPRTDAKATAGTTPGDKGDTKAEPVAAKPAKPPKPLNPVKQIVIPEKLYKGYTQRIEDPKGSMEHFYRELADAALQKKGAVARVSHWGDSTIAADGMTSMARRLFQTTFGDAGRGFVLVESGTDWYFPKDVQYFRKGWRAKQIISGKAKDGRYGMGGNAAVGWKGAIARYRTVEKGPVGRSVGEFKVFYRKGPKSGDFEVTVDKAPDSLPVVKTLADAYGDGVWSTGPLNDGPHRFQVRAAGNGPVRVYGVSMERPGKTGVIYDMLAVVGARASRMLNYDAKHLAHQIEATGTDLMVIHFGGNSLTSKGMSMRWYRERYEKVIALYKQAAPNKSCLVLTPIDHGERHRGRIRTKPDLLKMVVVQRDVALKAGCAFYSIFEAMGGEGTMGRWYRERPPLVSGDYAHATKHGARVLGSLFFKSLMAGFKDWVAAQPKHLPETK